MSIREQIAYLEDLSSTDEEIRRLDEQLEKHQKGLSGMRSEVKGLEERLKADREMLASMEKTRAELITELRQMTQQVDRSREKLGRSRNERESNAAQREIEELRKLHRDREDEIERLTTGVDSARTAIDETEAKRAAIAGDLAGSADGITTSIGQLEEERKGRAAHRATIVGMLPQVLYRRYESIRSKRPVAIARTYDGTCLGCRIAVPPMMFQKMRSRAEFEQCPQCRRILYYVDAAAEPPPSSKA